MKTTDDFITIDIDRLRNELMNENLAGNFGVGLGGMLIEAMDIQRMSPEDLVQLAHNQGIDLRIYQV